MKAHEKITPNAHTMQNGEYVFAQYFVFSGSGEEKYYLPCRNWYYVNMTTGAITVLAT